MICAKQHNLDFPSFTNFWLRIRTTDGEYTSPTFEIERLNAIKGEVFNTMCNDRPLEVWDSCNKQLITFYRAHIVRVEYHFI